ncbi:hypothetical protein EW146_g9473 [Bondarzewia mesenterica]|uniref:Integrase catalytic domain-containing protein n=1 Tax=Bondarzewia mesenterica TaxID=1095465 RepID=A0A4S4L6G1_9AGAM|nr:hypothetical protein EW146_g9473 [Bondarzewia mesenterica]
MPTASLGGKHYAFGLHDSCSAWATIAFLASKMAEETLAALKNFVSWLETQTGRSVCRVWTDNGTEFVNDLWRGWCTEKGIIHETSVPYSPAQNGMSECGNRTWMEHVRTRNGGVHWESSPIRPQSHSSAWEVIFGWRPHVEHLCAYGSIAYAKILDERRTKLDGKTVKCLLIGYNGRDAYRLYEPASGHVFVSRDVVFDEGLGRWSRPPVATVEGETVELQDRIANVDHGGDAEKSSADAAPTDVAPTSVNTPEPQDPRQQPNPDLSDPNTLPKPATSLPLLPNAPYHSTHLMRSSRAAKESREYEDREMQARRVGDDWAADGLIANLASHDGPLADPNFMDTVLAFIADTAHALPKTLEEAIEHPELWQEAIEKELTKMREYNVWDVVPLPKDAELMDYHWVFAEKFDADGKVTGHKARLVGKGYSQRFGVNFLWKSAAVVHLETVRTALALAAIMDLELWQVDFESTFLNAPIDSDIYMHQPRGFEEAGKEDWVCRLNKAIYGTKQSGNNWWLELDRAYQRMGYSRLFADYCTRSKTTGTDRTITLTNTDDTLGLSTSPAETLRAKGELGTAYRIKDMGGANGEPEFILGIRVERDRPCKTIRISQRGFLLRVLEHAGMADCSAEVTPLPVGGAYHHLFEPINDAE